MKIILLSSVRRLGNPGSVVLVKGGFGRYLVQSGFALRASNQNLEQVEKNKESLIKRQIELIGFLRTVSSFLNDKVLTFIRSAGSDGRLFGSVNKRDIALSSLKLLKGEMRDSDFDLNQNHVLLQKPIKDLGCLKVKLSVHPDVEEFSIVVNVAASEELAAIALKKFLGEESVPKD